MKCLCTLLVFTFFISPSLQAEEEYLRSKVLPGQCYALLNSKKYLNPEVFEKESFPKTFSFSCNYRCLELNDQWITKSRRHDIFVKTNEEETTDVVCQGTIIEIDEEGFADISHIQAFFW